MTYLIPPDLTERHFQKISQLVYQLSGINLKEGKESLVRFRLLKRLRALGIESFDEYMKYLEHDKSRKEIFSLIEVMTTNKTNFFREMEHFRFLREKIVPGLKGSRIRFWSAGCSSGEEPFSLAILLREEIPDLDSRDVKILATDISIRMLERVKRAVYDKETLRDLSPILLQKYFLPVRNESLWAYQVKGNVRAMVRTAWLNLMDPWPMKGPFNGIFCRNVMIYFDRQTQQKLINRFWDLLAGGGFLFLGHSESLSAISHKFTYVQPAVFRK